MKTGNLIALTSVCILGGIMGIRNLEITLENKIRFGNSLASQVYEKRITPQEAIKELNQYNGEHNILFPTSLTFGLLGIGMYGAYKTIRK